jgi:hypothetical protein
VDPVSQEAIVTTAGICMGIESPSDYVSYVTSQLLPTSRRLLDASQFASQGGQFRVESYAVASVVRATIPLNHAYAGFLDEPDLLYSQLSGNLTLAISGMDLFTSQLHRISQQLNANGTVNATSTAVTISPMRTEYPDHYVYPTFPPTQEPSALGGHMNTGKLVGILISVMFSCGMISYCVYRQYIKTYDSSSQQEGVMKSVRHHALRSIKSERGGLVYYEDENSPFFSETSL